MNADKRDKDCFPLPPTPTSKACPPEFMTTLTIRAICFIASSNNTCDRNRNINRKLKQYLV